MVDRVQTLAFGYPEGRIELQLIGGYRDQPGGYADDLFYNIMREYSFHFDLTYVFISETMSLGMRFQLHHHLGIFR